VVGPLRVQWALAAGTAEANTSGPPSDMHETHTSTTVTVEAADGSSLAAATLSPSAREWVWDRAQLEPHAQYTLHVGSVQVRFRAGPYGKAGVPGSGWVGNWTGGANAIRGVVNLQPALRSNEWVSSAVLYAASPATMSWDANGARLHDSVLDPGYSTQSDLRVLYMAYDLTPSFGNGSTVQVDGRLGFGKFGYLDQWCDCGSLSMGPGVCGLSAECRPLTAQVVVTTTSGRVLACGTGVGDTVFELAHGAVTARFEGGNVWTGRADGAPFVYTHLYHGETYALPSCLMRIAHKLASNNCMQCYLSCM
jgi:hypothetical protein